MSGDCETRTTRVADEVHARMPVLVDDRRVEVVFSDAQTGSRTMPLDLRPWSDVRPHFPDDVQISLDQLVAHVPDLDSGRRLVLWHGVPGTGKTTAVRALLHAWRVWADAVVVTDPDEMLKDGRYLRRVLLDGDRTTTGGSSSSSRTPRRCCASRPVAQR